jgi:hypothetical protein
MPGNRRLREVIISKADLLIDDNLPDCLTAFCAHVSGWEVTIRRWQDGDHSVTGSAIDFPVEVHEYALRSFSMLKQEQMRLLGGRSRRAGPHHLSRYLFGSDPREHVVSWRPLIGLAVPGRAIRSLVAEDERGSARDQTGTGTLVGPCWVRSRQVNRRQQRARAVTRCSQKPQVAPPTGP